MSAAKQLKKPRATLKEAAAQAAQAAQTGPGRPIQKGKTGGQLRITTSFATELLSALQQALACATDQDHKSSCRKVHRRLTERLDALAKGITYAPAKLYSGRTATGVEFTDQSLEQAAALLGLTPHSLQCLCNKRKQYSNRYGATCRVSEDNK